MNHSYLEVWIIKNNRPPVYFDMACLNFGQEVVTISESVSLPTHVNVINVYRFVVVQLRWNCSDWPRSCWTQYHHLLTSFKLVFEFQNTLMEGVIVCSDISMCRVFGSDFLKKCVLRFLDLNGICYTSNVFSINIDESSSNWGEIIVAMWCETCFCCSG